jgi:predicted transcriptional regulator
MTNDVIRERDSRYEEYESLLSRRDALRKEGEAFRMEYLRVFGDLINEIFRTKIECISKKKQIAWCRARVNRGEALNRSEMNHYIEAVMAEYNEQLEEMVNQTSAAKTGSVISFSDLRKIKEIYRHLAKLIHPDRRPDLAEDETIRDLWNRIVTAYTYNHLASLEELQFLTENYLASLSDSAFEFEIPDLDEKFQKLREETEAILTSLPYTYRFILEDEEERKERKQELEDELKSYTEYAKQLDEVLSTFSFKENYS